jgi:prepilin-type N-terminal cleavage/methylation domain-containing protein
MLKRNQSGYTLIELMITVALFTILVLVTYPVVYSVLTKREIVEVSRTFSDMVQFSRVQSLLRNRAYELKVYLNSGVKASNGRVVINEGATAKCDFDPNNPGYTAGVRIFDLSINKTFTSATTVDNLCGGKVQNCTGSYIKIISIDPSELASSSLCFTPDGRVLQTGTKQPVRSLSSDYAAGNAVFSLRRYSEVGGTGTADGPIHDVTVPYNGIPEITYREL